ncbi:MAG TPA: M56 family metallopeptidase [Bacteroidales bacterium]|nr:M56 family metallopeptidase [Bacteroidales bacterium]
MAEFIIKSSVGIAISYLLYRCCIRNQARFYWVRIYFLTAIAASAFIPLLAELFRFGREVWIEVPEAYRQVFIQAPAAARNVTTATVQASSSFSFNQLVLSIYLTGLVIVLLRFIGGLAHLLFLTIKYGIRKAGTDRLVVIQNLDSPFSFLHLIFINRQILSDASKCAVLEHERAHVRQWHSLDLIAVELLVAFQWFNPFAWLLRRAVKELHEYLADDEVVKHLSSPLEYQVLLFNQACGTSLSLPVNGFNNSITKKRILMITHKKSHKWYATLAAFIIALVAIQSLSRVNFAQDPPKKPGIDASQQNAAAATDEEDMDASLVAPPAKKDPNAPPPPPFPLFQGTKSFQETLAKMRSFIAENNQLPPQYANAKIKNGIFVKVMFDDNGKVSSVETGPQSKKLMEQLQPANFDTSPATLAEVERVLQSAPAFKLLKSTDGKLCNGAVYCLIFEKNECQVIPCKWYFKSA